LKITAAITTYNRLEQLKKAIKSVENQSFLPEELIIVDDNSSNETQKFCENLTAKFPVIYFRNEKNMGAGNSRTQAIERANGDYIAFLDDDDEWETDKLLKQNEFAEEKFDLIYTASKTFSEKNGIYNFSDKIYFQKPFPFPSKIAILFGNFAGITSTMMFNLNFLRKIGGFDGKFPALEDYELVIRAVNNGAKIKGIKFPLVKYRAANLQNVSASSNNVFVASKMILSKTSFYLKPFQFICILRIFAGEFVKSKKFRENFLKKRD
jgi:glycosyltransferase involved in cell wall biosynthesis